MDEKGLTMEDENVHSKETDITTEDNNAIIGS